MLDTLKPLKSPGLDEYKKLLNEGLIEANKKLDLYINEKRKVCDYIEDCVHEGSPSKDHGVVSWVHVINIFESMKRDENFIKEVIPAFAAIFKHSAPIASISSKDEPISFLLLLCDKLQEWGRPRVELSDLTERISSSMHYSGIAKLDLKKIVTHLEINFNIDVKNKKFTHKNSGMNFTLKYGESKNTTVEPAIIWAELSYDFKRVSFPDSMIPIRLEFIHKFSKADADDKWYPNEFELMQEFALTTDAGSCLIPWFDSTKDNSGINHEVKENEEIFKIELNKLKNLKELTKMPAKFYETYSTWKKEKIKKIQERI